MKKRYVLSGKMTIGVSVEVEADDEDQAEEIGRAFTAQTCVGDGSVSGLLGLRWPHSVEGVIRSTVKFFDTDCYPEWDDVEEAT